MAAAVVSSADQEKHKIDQASKAGEDFAKLFYETLEKRRHLLGNLFLDTANLVWNGNPHSGKTDISRFYESLPACETELVAIDAQPIRGEFVQVRPSWFGYLVRLAVEILST